MPEWIEIPDATDPGTRGRVRIDRRTSVAPKPAIVLVGGMTQTLASWGAQLRPLSERGPVVAYEARGQGSTELSLDDCSLSRHVDDFVALHAALDFGGPIDLCGFSFGGRLALAVAATRPDLVRRLVLTGVALDRGIVGRLITQAWIAALAGGGLEVLARVTLPDILGPRFLAEHEPMIEAMVRATVDRNRPAAILALMRATLDLPPDSPWTTAALAVRARSARVNAVCLGGALDRVSPPDEVDALAVLLGAPSHTIDAVGHTVAIESPERWREIVTRFLDGDA